jgi:hypothetical protein
MVGEGQVRGQEPHRREVDRSLFEQVQDGGEAASGAGGLDAVVGLVLGEAEHVPAVGEERRMAHAQVRVAGVQLGQVRDQEGGGAALARGEVLDPGQ